MRIIDVDAHFHEPIDWLQRTAPAIAGSWRRAAGRLSRRSKRACSECRLPRSSSISSSIWANASVASSAIGALASVHLASGLRAA